MEIRVIRGNELSKLHPQEDPIPKIKTGNEEPQTIRGEELSSLWGKN